MFYFVSAATQCSWSMEIDRKNEIKIIVVSSNGHTHTYTQRQLSKCTPIFACNNFNCDKMSFDFKPATVSFPMGVQTHSERTRVCGMTLFWSVFSAPNPLGKLNSIFDCPNHRTANEYSTHAYCFIFLFTTFSTIGDNFSLFMHIARTQNSYTLIFSFGVPVLSPCIQLD